MMVVGAGLEVTSRRIYISNYLDIPSGPAIPLTLLSYFVLALLFNPSKGISTDGLGFDSRQNTP